MARLLKKQRKKKAIDVSKTVTLPTFLPDQQPSSQSKSTKKGTDLLKCADPSLTRAHSQTHRPTRQTEIKEHQ